MGRKWFERTNIPLLAWSAQAWGFFAGRATPEDRAKPELVRCLHSGDNFERLARACKLADAWGVAPTAVALAYVLRQAFPTLAVIGPRTVDQTRSSARAVTIDLTPDQVAWLDLRGERP